MLPLVLFTALCLVALGKAISAKAESTSFQAAKPTAYSLTTLRLHTNHVRQTKCFRAYPIVRRAASVGPRYRRYLYRFWGLRHRQILHALSRCSAPAAPPAVDGCLSELIQRESGWNVHATNSKTGAYGLPQALPGSKMASAGPDWHDNPATQIRWMLGYVRKYGGSCGALAFQKAKGWY